MAVTSDIETSQGVVQAVIRNVAPDVMVQQLQVMSVFNIPTESIHSSQYSVQSVVSRMTDINVSNLTVQAVVRGKIDSPKIQSWYYTMDAHDFWILKLGTSSKTLAFDLLTEQWGWWTSSDDVRWRASTGLNWPSAGSIPINFGSNVIVGDDSFGVLWVLDPEKGTDDALLDDTQTTFPRIATGQMISRGRVSTPVYSVYLTASLGDPSIAINDVLMEYSDDQGHTYITADPPQIANPGGYYQQFVWRSMGQVHSPGRLFRLTDNGSFARIDGLDVNV